MSGEIGIRIGSDGGTDGGSLDVRVTLTNGTSETVTLVRPTWIPNFVKFTVRDSAGTSMPFYGPQNLLRPLEADGFVTLAPGESAEEVLDLGPGFQLDPGTYLITAEYRNPAGGSHEGERAVIFEHGEGPQSEPIEAEVSP